MKNIENEAAAFAETIYITINDNRKDAEETARRVNELAEDVKTNAEKIENIDENNNILILKIGKLEQAEETKNREISDKSNGWEDQIKKLETGNGTYAKLQTKQLTNSMPLNDSRIQLFLNAVKEP